MGSNKNLVRATPVNNRYRELQGIGSKIEHPYEEM